MQCHLETTSLDLPHSIRRFDRAPFSYVPGQPLGDFSVEFDRPGGMKDRFEIAQRRVPAAAIAVLYPERGQAALHHVPRPARHPARTGGGRALQRGLRTVPCRKARSGRLRGPHAAGADCIACHMPKRRTDDVVHVVMTDHLIQRQKPAGDLLAPKAEFIETAAESISAARWSLTIRRRSPIPRRTPCTPRPPRFATGGISPRVYRGWRTCWSDTIPPQAGFYAELAQGYGAAGDWAKAIPYFEEAARREPTAFRLVQLGNALMEDRQFPQAEAALRRAIGLAPDEPSGWGTLGWVLWQQDKGAEARADLERAVALDPEVPEVHNNLANVEWGTGDQAAAEQQFREALRIQPGIAEWRLNLARVLATRGEIPEARFQFEQAIRLKPDSAEARLDYGRLLADHGELPAAIRQLETAVRLQPDLWRAHFELAMALGQSGNAGAAREQLTIAANGSDAEVRAQALDVLQRLGR